MKLSDIFPVPAAWWFLAPLFTFTGYIWLLKDQYFGPFDKIPESEVGWYLGVMSLCFSCVGVWFGVIIAPLFRRRVSS